MESLLREFEAVSEEWERIDQETVFKLKEMLAHLQDEGFINASATEILDKWKTLHVSVSKFAKSLEKKMKHEPSGTDALPSPTDPERAKRIDVLVKECLLHHFYRQGEFQVAELLVNEAGLNVEAGLKEPYVKLSELAGQLRSGNVFPSLEWAKDNRIALKEFNGRKLEFELCRLQYLLLLRSDPNEALRFAQDAFPPLSESFSSDIQTLMGCLAYAPRLDTSPYKTYLQTDYLELACSALSSAYCRLQRLPQESALTQCIRLGISSLPKIDRVMALMKERKGLEWSQQGELPVEIPLPNELRYHSVFVCPVLKQQSSEDNPPMMLPCGHVICQEALGRLSKSSQHVRFKCPYCPSEGTASQCVRVYF